MTARAFVPGHVTGFFSVHAHDDPVVAGSRGAGLALSDGVTVTVDPVETVGDGGVVLDGDSVEMPAVTGVVERLGTDARVVAETDLPISAGFGVSGACALGTALALDAATAGGHTERELVAVAHASEVEAGTGLGDVVGQARGGMPIRLDPGAPPRGYLDGLPARPDVEYVTFGGLDTAEVIGGDTETLSRAGEEALETLRTSPTVETFMRACRRFSREAGLQTDEVRAAIEDVQSVGGEAAMAMLGQTVFALDDGLSRAGYDARSCRVTAGATLVGE
ncbi:pantoate kinase [Halomarina oriensis]|uniref:Pantoate kinase n=1 Tax=Halomarina oriensis TaxID=671145 RepID=A0A6B0GTN8_9EURY|nr:pantoate kinase [Halomarina oriensis]MWG35495.1 sugar kinase [Halomarina oriensis]